jgi:hypothetical protein
MEKVQVADLKINDFNENNQKEPNLEKGSYDRSGACHACMDACFCCAICLSCINNCMICINLCS